MTTSTHTTIIGAGLTGLTTAFRLAKLRPPSPANRITLIDQAPRTGGWVDSRKEVVVLPDGTMSEVILEKGPRSIRPRGSKGAVKMLKLIKELDLAPSILPVSLSHPAAKNRYLLDPSTFQLTLLPSSLTSVLRPASSPLLRGLLTSILKEPFVPRLHGESDVSLDSLVRRRLGPSVADNVISAMIHGIYGADTRVLSVRSSLPVLWEAEQKRGSIVLGMLRGMSSAEDRKKEEAEWRELGELGRQRESWSLYGLKGGIGVLTSRMEVEARKLGVEFLVGSGVDSIALENDSPKVTLSNGTSIPSTTVVSTTHPSLLSPLLAPSTLPHLTHNPSTTIAVINLVFPGPPSSIHPAGFGYLIPRSSNAAANPEGVLGVVFDSTSVEGLDSDQGSKRSAGLTKLTVMIGGPHWSTYLSSPSTFTRPAVSDLPDLALSHLRRVFPFLPAPIYSKAFIHESCIPTYLVHHGQRMRELHEAVNARGWAGKLVLTGSGYGGIGVNDCVGMGWEVAERVAKGEDGITGLERWEAWE